MTILQAGVPKSGNYWLYTILISINQKAGLEYKSFLRTHPIYKVAQTWDLSFAGQNDMDFLNIKKNYCEFRISAVFQEEIADIDDYINKCSLVWTHSPMNSYGLEVLSKFNKIVYIIRDPRDVAISYSKYCFTEHKLKNHPPHYEENPESYLENRLDVMLRNWVNHVGGYLKYQDKLNIYPIFYERFLNDIDSELPRLLDYLEIELDQNVINQIKSDVSFDRMKKQSPKHLRKGKSAQWRQVFTSKQKAKAERIAGEMMELLNYPISESEESLPSIPLNISQTQLETAITPAKLNVSENVKQIYNFITSERTLNAKANLFKDWSTNKIKRVAKGR
ncbi:MAG: sulfotransferase domain-containing protein [Rivularia sp. (in: cyanobacteria)]